MKNKADEIFDQVVFEMASLMFGDGNMSDAILRLVRTALQHRGLENFIKKTIEA